MNSDSLDPRVYADLKSLSLLELKIAGLSFLPKQPVRSLLSGKHASRVRGRGLNFEEIRLYHPGDDVRTIDWKVTARTRKTYTRVFNEERDRPVLVLVDQRIGMFFGSCCYTKSFIASQLAALTSWKILDQGDRIGAVIFNDRERMHVPCRRSKENVYRILTNVVSMNHELTTDSQATPNPEMLVTVLEEATRLATHDYLIVVISDFHGLDEKAYQSLKTLRWHNDVLGMLVHDPLASKLTDANEMVISDGELMIEVGGGSQRKRVAAATSGRISRVLELQRELGIPMLPISTQKDALPQLLHLLGQGGVR